MARKRATKKASALWTKAEWKRFVNVRLNSQEKEAIGKKLLSVAECYQSLEDMATGGYKVSLSYSPTEDTHTVSLTGVWKGKPNAGLTMSMRHRDFIKAITAMAWCQLESDLDGGWEERFGERDTDDW